jgi:hypothetical protein
LYGDEPPSRKAEAVRNLRPPRQILILLASVVVLTAGSVMLEYPTASAAVCASRVGTPCVRDFAGQPSWGFDGRVRTMLRVGNTVYLGGRFTHASLVNPDGSVAQTVERDHLAALDVTQGTLLDWGPRIVPSGTDNGDIYSLVSYKGVSGTWVIAVGDFTSVATTSNGSSYGTSTRQHVAAFLNDRYGSLTSFAPDVSYRPRTALVSGATLYLGGSFTKLDGQKRSGLGSVTLPTGTLNTWAPSANGGVDQLAGLANGNIAVAGEFTSVSDGTHTTTTPYLAVVTPGGALAWTAASPAPSAKALCVTTNNNDVYVGEGLNGNAVAAFNGDSGVRLWQASTNGDVQAVGFAGGQLFAGGHFGEFLDQGGTTVKIKKLAALDPATGLVDTGWKPGVAPAASLGVWGITGTDASNPDKLFIGGDFTSLKQIPSWRFGQYSVTGS